MYSPDELYYILKECQKIQREQEAREERERKERLRKIEVLESYYAEQEKKRQRVLAEQEQARIKREEETKYHPKTAPGTIWNTYITPDYIGKNMKVIKKSYYQEGIMNALMIANNTNPRKGLCMRELLPALVEEFKKMGIDKIPKIKSVQSALRVLRKDQKIMASQWDIPFNGGNIRVLVYTIW